MIRRKMLLMEKILVIDKMSKPAYKVQAGDTSIEIARALGMSLDELAKLNPGKVKKW